MKHASHLHAKVAAQNRANAAANDFATRAAKAFKPLVGKKVLTIHGTLTEQAKKLLPPLTPEGQTAPPSAGLHHWHDHSGYTLRFGVRCSETYGDGFAAYGEAVAYIGELAGQTLKSVASDMGKHQDLRTDYTAEEVTAARAAFEAARNAASKAESACYPFGTNPNN